MLLVLFLYYTPFVHLAGLLKELNSYFTSVRSVCHTIMKCPLISLTVTILNIIVFFFIINWKKIYTNRRHYPKCRLLVISLHLWCIRTSKKLSTSEPLTTSFMQAEQQLSGRQLSMHVFGRLVLWSHIPPSLQTDWKELWSTILLAGTNSRFYRV